MRIESLLKDYHIPYATEGKNVRSNWIGVDCPFCPGSKENHLGYSLDEHYFSCWRCGGHSQRKVIARLLSVSTTKAESIIEKYGGNIKIKTEPRVRIGTNKFKLPNGTGLLQRNHIRYLEKRRFDSDKLKLEWDIQGTGPIAKLDELNYANRILAPITWNDRVVSFQARDITNKHMAKYMACPPEREIISHKHVLYGRQDKWGSRGICVEGITDVWRLGPSSFATLGIKYTAIQVRAIAKAFEEVVIVFDPGDQAQEQAMRLKADLNGKNIRAWIEILDTDPGDMSQDDANHLIKQLL